MPRRTNNNGVIIYSERLVSELVEEKLDVASTRIRDKGKTIMLELEDTCPNLT